MSKKYLANSKKVPTNISIDNTDIEELTLLTPTTLAFFENTVMSEAPTTNFFGNPSIIAPTNNVEILSDTSTSKHKTHSENYSEEDSDVTTSECSVVPTSTTKTTSTKNKAMKRKLPGPRPAYSDDELTPEDMQRRIRRRERNKMAASRCRQRRVDQTNELLNETKSLEMEGNRLEKEIEELEKLKQRLEVVLHSHLPLCAANLNLNNPVVEIKPVSSFEDVSSTSLQANNEVGNQPKTKVTLIKLFPNNAFRPNSLTTNATISASSASNIQLDNQNLLQTPIIKSNSSLPTPEPFSAFDYLTPTSLGTSSFSPLFNNPEQSQI